MAKMNVFVVVNATDNASAKIKELSSQFDQLGTKMSKAEKAFNISSKIALAAQGMNTFATAARKMVMGPILLAAKLEEAVASVSAKGKGTVEEMKLIHDAAARMGATTRYTAIEAAQGMDKLAMSGFKVKQNIVAMPAILALASAGQTQIGETAEIASDILRGFGKEAKDMGNVADVLVSTFTGSSTDLRKLGDTMKYMAPTASDLGISLEKSAGFAALLANSGIKASKSGTAMRAVFNRLNSPAKRVRDTLKSLSVDVLEKDGTGNMRDFVYIMNDLNKALEGTGSGKRQTILARIFGEEPVSSVSVMLKRLGTGEMSDFFERLEKSAGTAGKVSQFMENNLMGATRGLNSAFEALSITVGETLLPHLKGLVESFRTTLLGMEKFVKNNPTLTKGIMVATAAIAALTSALVALMFTAVAATSSYGSILVVITALGDAMSWLRVKILTKALPAIWSFTAALVTNPIFLVVAAIGLLAGAAFLIYKNWEPIKAWWLETWAMIETYTIGFWERFKNASLAAKIVVVAAISAIMAPLVMIFGPLALLAAGAQLIISNWEPISTFFDTLWKGVKVIFDNAGIWIDAKITWFETRINELFNLFKGFENIQIALGVAGDIATTPARAAASVGGFVADTAADAYNVFAGTSQSQSKTQVGGTLKIEVNSEGRAKVSHMQSEGGIDFEVDNGFQMVSQ